MNVREAMTPDPIVIHPDDSAYEAAARMARHDVRHLPVVDGDALLVGIVTDRDLRHYLLSLDAMAVLGTVSTCKLLEAAVVRSIMTWPVLVTSADARLSTAVATMRDRRVGALIVVEERRVVGILTETDLLRRIVAAEPAAAGIEAAVTDVVVSYP